MFWSTLKDNLKHLQSSKAVTKVKLLKGHVFSIVLQLRKVNSKALFKRLYQQNRTQSQDNGLLHAEGQAIQTSEIDVTIIAQLCSQWDRGQTFLQLILHCNFNRLTIFPLKISMGNWKFSAGWPAKSARVDVVPYKTNAGWFNPASFFVKLWSYEEVGLVFIISISNPLFFNY